MINEELKNRLVQLVGTGVRLHEPLANHSAIKVGGPADVFVLPKNMDELVGVFKLAKDEGIVIFVLGAGSNILFRDGGFEGIILSTAGLDSIKIESENDSDLLVKADAGVPLSELVGISVDRGASGFEYLAGIPGTVGGALYMNAGTHEGVISDALALVIAADKSGRIYEWPKEKLEFSYRRTLFPKPCVVLSAEFKLSKHSKTEIEKKVEELRARRSERHPLGWPSLGSIFKNPRAGVSAGELIEDAGLKGVRVGRARVSEKHANWIINEGGASASDVEVLLHLVRDKVGELTGILLEPEIVIVGRRL